MMVVMRLCALCAIVVLALPSVAMADESEEEKADRLFLEGRELLVQGRVAEACARLEESVRLSPAGGALLNLAECLERAGQITRAWGLFREASSRAARVGRWDAEQIAHDRAARLEPRLPRVVVVVETPNEPLVVKRDGDRVASEAWGAAVPVDPGVHEVVAEQPGRMPFRWSGTIGEGARVEVRVPALLPIVPRVPPPQRSASPLRWVGAGVGIAGLAAVGVGVGLFARAVDLHGQAIAACPQPNACGEWAPLLQGNEARSLADASTVLVVAGSVTAAAGLGLFLFAPRGETSTTARLGLGFVTLERRF